MNEKLQLSEYNILLGNHWNVLQERLAVFSKIFVLVDENTKEHCLPIFNIQLPNLAYTLIEIQSGEPQKNIHTCSKIWDAMFAAKADRGSIMINLGGGVIGDMGGFCASTYMRGIAFIQIPTTLLSQVDSSIGGKLGIDHKQIKNAIGLFQNPLAVFVHRDFLGTLPKRQIRSGLAEMLKHGLIADPDHWHQLLNVDSQWTSYDLIKHSLKIKKQVVERDFKESSYRKVLNFGHTLGHAIETTYLEKDNFLLHGEAIGIGMIMESYLSHKQLGLSKSQLSEVAAGLNDIYQLGSIEEELIPEIKEYIQLDKKNTNGYVQFTLLENIGKAIVNQTSPDELIEESIQYYNDLVG